MKKMVIEAIFFILFLKHFQLGGRGWPLYLFHPSEYFHHSKLLVSNTHYDNMAFGWQEFFNPGYMRIGVFPAHTVSEVYAPLEQFKSILHDILSKPGVSAPIPLSDSWQIKEYNYPHYTICV